MQIGAVGSRLAAIRSTSRWFLMGTERKISAAQDATSYFGSETELFSYYRVGEIKLANKCPTRSRDVAARPWDVRTRAATLRSGRAGRMLNASARDRFAPSREGVFGGHSIPVAQE